MIELKPGWADAFTKACATKDEKTVAEALGHAPRKVFRLDPARLAASAARGGRIGGRVRKENYAKKRSG